ncbi:SDR family oxidoreductase [Xenorhabdus innexi]|uniref:3-ketoacyl-ACP-reductase CylG n=1 Tax=Xenorhabdus innexi TaxID=290109 RepID=A0A1N6MRS4_9GAMM|nr:SDR family oxidoreductase [Xenorhabdus innexi]PHM38550.1 3-ketoacyl-ACP-reductase CylG [Xenorhabdus innexi]SIP71548.1 Sepiapterin reductase [Xenorhabdus innexi]
MKILITAKNSDLARYLTNNINTEANNIETPSKEELNVSDIESVKHYFSKKTFDIVINFAGSLYSSTIVESEPEKWINDINTNLIGTYLVNKFALIKNENCQIINISSTAAFNAYSDWSSYCASKAGVLKVSQALYKDGYNIITLCPGAIQTKLRDSLSIKNPNIMTIEEGCQPIINAFNGHYTNGSIIFYRKNEFKFIEKY